MNCDTYSTESIDGLWSCSNAPYLDVTVTADSAFLYISVVNRHATDSINAVFDFPFTLTGKQSKQYEMYSNSYSDANTPNAPDKIKIKEENISFPSSYKFPLHSFTLFQVPLSGEVIVHEPANKSLTLSLSPNPATDQLTIKPPYDLNNESEITIYNEVGSIVYYDNLLIGQSGINLNILNFPNGVYYIKVKNSTFIFTGSFCKIQ